MTTRVDLRQLAVERNGSNPASPPLHRHRRHLVTRFMLPAILLASFGLLFVYAAWGTLYPPRPVTVIPVITSQSELDAPADTPMFRAAGWVEPRPTPTLVTALAEGVVDELLVVEGQKVKQGEVVARLVTADAQIALATAEADIKLREGELAAAKAALIAANSRLDKALHLKSEVADAAAAVAKIETDAAGLPHLLRAAEARLQFTRTDLENKQSAADALAKSVLLKAKSESETAEAAVEHLRTRQRFLPVELAALKDKRDLLAEKLTLKTDEKRQAAEAEAAVQIAESRLTQALAAGEAARLRLARMEVRSPISGRVLALVAKPGSRLMGLELRALTDASTVVTLYEPAKLQVRVDVRLDDVAKVVQGQKVRIETAALPGKPLDGFVLAATSFADIQKNTLAVKVAIENPPAELKPEMLCQAVFLAPAKPKRPEGTQEKPYRLLVPKELVELSGESGNVWVVDLTTGAARRQTVEAGQSLGDLVEIRSGLNSTDRLIVEGRQGLREGERIHVAGEDQSLGLGKLADGSK